MKVNFRLIAVLFTALLVAIMVAVQIGQGNFKTAYTSTLVVVSVPMLLILGVKTWYFLPFSMMALLPAIPFLAGRSINLAEVSILAFTGMFLITLTMGRVRFRLPVRDWWPMLLFSAWIMFIAILDGGGLAVFGASTFGGRRYLTVVLAVIGMIGISQFGTKEKQAKRFSLSITAALILSGVYVAYVAYMGSATMATYEFYNWQQGLSLISLGGVMLLFAHYKPANIFLSPKRLLYYLILLALVAYSGKRMLFGVCCIIPVFAGIWHSQKGLSLVTIAIGALAIMGVAIAQNSGARNIPQSLQRVLSFVPADWDADVEMSSNNKFRDTLNRWAWRNVKENPIIGKGISMTMEDYMVMESDEYIAKIKYEDDDPQAFTHIAGKNWHSTWLGLAASFGYPAAFLWMIVQIMTIVRAWRLSRHPQAGRWVRTLLGIIFFYMVYGIVRSLSTGDIALLIVDGALLFGLLSSINYGFKQNEKNRSIQMI